MKTNIFSTFLTITGDKNALDGTFTALTEMVKDLNGKLTGFFLVLAALTLTVSIGLSKFSKKESVVSSAEEWTKRILVGCGLIIISSNVISYIVGYVANN